MSPTPVPPRARRVFGARTAALTAAAALIVAVVAFGLRVLYHSLVFTREGVLPVDPDAFYHFRRIAYSVRNFPATLAFDPYVNFPRGGEPIWSPAFDLGAAALVRAALGDPEPAAMERLLCWVPPFLGAVHVALLFLIGRRFLSAPAAFAGALLLALLPGHFSYSQLGFVDHHAAVSLAGSLVLFAAMAFAARPGVGQGAALTFAFAGALLLWPGSLIHVGVAQAALLAVWLARGERGPSVRTAALLAAAHAGAALFVAPFGLGRTWLRWGAWSPLVLSGFQPLWLGAGAACFALLAGLYRRTGVSRSRARRAASAAAVGAVVAGLVVAAVPELASRGAGDALAWLARGEEFQAVVGESQPLLVRAGRVQLWPAVVLLSGGFVLGPLAVAALLIAARRVRRPELAVLALWSAAFLLLAAIQWRFVADAAAALALLLPAVVDVGLAPAAPLRRRRLALVAFAAGVVLALPALDFYAKRPLIGRTGRRTMALGLELGRWLRANSPPTSGWLGDGPLPEYGVLAPWGLGHALRYAAQRPLVQDNFGDDVGEEGFSAAEAYFSAPSEEAGLAILAA
ncbi:MAG TPA: STT3 domain-containing protein, partial [Myxococcota bacterium]|nr:STT3 domain-containing protein [Myxococcota bacterium]